MPRSRIQNDAFVERKPAETRLLRMAGTHGTRSAGTTGKSLFGPEKSNPWLPTAFSSALIEKLCFVRLRAITPGIGGVR